MNPTLPTVMFGLSLLAFALIPCPVFAFDWSYEADLDFSGEYNTNILLSPLPHQDVWGTLLGANLDVSAKSEPWTAGGSIRILDARYFGQQGLDTTNLFAHLNGQYDISERARLKFEGKYVLDSSLSGLSEGQGLVARRLRRSLVEIIPSWAYSLSERWILELSYKFNDLSYDQADLGASSRVVDSNAHTGIMDLSYNLSETTSLNTNLQFISYTADPPKVREMSAVSIRHKFVNAVLGVDHDIDPTLQIGLSAGGQFIQSDRNTIVVSDQALSLGVLTGRNEDLRTEYVVDAYIKKEFEIGYLRAEFARGIAPSIFGDLQKKNRISLMGRYSFLEELSAGLRFDYFEFRNRNSADIEISGNRINRDVYRIDADLLWNWTEALSLQAAYRYIHQTRERIPGVQFGHRIFLTLRYHWDKTSI